MHRIAWLSLLLAFLCVGSLCAQTPASSGHWQGYMQRGSSQLAVTFDFPADDATHGSFSAPDLGAIDIPLAHVKRGHEMHWELVGDTSTTVFDGTLTGNSMSGAFIDPAGNGRFILRRLSASTQKPYTQRDVTFANGNVRVAGTLFVPRARGKHPAILFVQGSGAEGRWASAYLADYVARHGIVALTFDKRGVGKSTGDWRTSTLQDLAADARAGIALLAHLPNVDRSNVGVCGHSQGAELAPAIAEDNSDVKWIIAADGPVGPLYKQDLFRVDTALAAHYSGKDLQDAERVYAEFVDVARSEKPHAQLRADIAAAGKAPWLDDLAIPDDSSWVWNWYSRAGNYDNTSAWASVRVPVLIIFGANDALVPPQESIAQTTAILRERGNPHVVVRVFPGADHTLHVPPKSASGWPRTPDGFPAIIVQFARGEL